MIRRLLVTASVLLLLTALAAGLLARWAWQEIHRPVSVSAGEDAPTILVEPGTPARAILEGLAAEGVIGDPLLARLYLVHVLDDPPLRAGEYRFEGELGIPAVLDRMIRGAVETYPLTLIEGLTYLEMAEKIAEAGFGDPDVLLEEVSRAELVADLDPAAENLEGYLYPDTYHFARGTPERVIVETLVATFRRRYEAEVAPVWTPSEEFGLRDLVTVASIVEKETQAPEERGLVASVYTNRLRIGMGLYADPTIIYAKKLDGTWDGNLRRPDLSMDSPYNTYRVPGLPPSPICSPSVASLLATAMPAETKYLYFVSRNDGTHVFAESKAEHDRNVYRWQKLYWRERWARERAERHSEDG